MDEAEAAELLVHGSAHERLAAARFFEAARLNHRREFLSSRLALESDTWTRRALRRALDAIDTGHSIAIEEEMDIGGAEDEELFMQAVGRATHEIVHELRPIVGILRLAALREVKPPYDKSRTRIQLDRLTSALRALDEMNQASALISLEPMDLSLVMSGLLTEFEDEPVEAAGPPSAEVVGNPGLVEIAVRNGIRNALESQAGAGVGESVVVTWNRTDKEAWVTVLDRGSGLPQRTSQIFQFGSSTKEGHIGTGLALAQRCAKSLQGSISVRNRDGGGAAFELRWPTVLPDDASAARKVEDRAR